MVTGAAGFIGTNLCEKLLSSGNQVIGIDSLTSNYDINIKNKNLAQLQEYSDFNFRSFDLLTAPIGPLLDNVEVIFHLAGQPSVQNSWGEDFQIYVDRNIVLTQRLLRSAIDAGITKFVNSSSSSIYGKVHFTPTPETYEKTPVSPYGVTKLAAENLCTLYGKEYGLPTVSLRYFTVYGPRQRPDMAFNKIIQAGLQGSAFNLHGDGSQLRDFTYVGDVVEANLLAAEAKTDPGSIFNIGGGSPLTMTSAIQEIEKILGRSVEVIRQPFGFGNPMITEADCTTAKNTLGWIPKVQIGEGLKSQVLWHRQFINQEKF